ncbi:MAG: hypothetical protein V4454_21570 [Pseudomonadota bacterium]
MKNSDNHPDTENLKASGLQADLQQPDVSMRAELLAGLRQGLIMGAAALVVILPAIHMARTSSGRPATVAMQAARMTSATPFGQHALRLADLGGEEASPDAKFIANWVADSRDNRNMSFVIIDKKNTKVFVFAADGKLVGATPVLLGAMPGDDSVTGIGKRLISEVRPEERTTPAGRFVGEPGRNATGENVVWVDYDAAVSMHRVRIVDPKERRLERLATPTTDDNRISYGCVNVPVAFFENILSPEFSGKHGVVYVLPEVKTVREVFPTAYDPSERQRVAKIASPALARL